MTELIIRVPDDMAHLIEEWAKHIPEMELVSREEAEPVELGDIDLRMTLALQTLKQRGVIRYAYDYTWIMLAISDGVIKGMNGFRSPQSFIDYLKRFGVERIPSRSTLSEWNNRVIGVYPRWEFTDTQDNQEICRRKSIVKQLISVMNESMEGNSEQKAGQLQ